MKFRVQLINLTEHTKGEWEYESLLDALRIAKNVDTSTYDDYMARPAMTDEFFNTHLWELLTMGFVYVRDDVMVFLWKLDENGNEHPVVTTQEMFKGVMIPSQSTPVGDTQIRCNKKFEYRYRPPVDINIMGGKSFVQIPPVDETSVDESNIVRGED